MGKNYENDCNDTAVRDDAGASVTKLKLRDEKEQIIVSNKNCTINSEAVLFSKNEVMSVYIEREFIDKSLDKSLRNLIAVKDIGTDEVVEYPVSYDSKLSWVKGVPNSDGYFTLTNPQTGKILETKSAVGLKIVGK